MRRLCGMLYDIIERILGRNRAGLRPIHLIKEVSMKRLILLALVLVLPVISGCLPKIAPDYPGGLAAEPADMKPFENSDTGIRMAIPAGWTAVPIPDGSDPKLKAQFKKDGTSGVLQVYCGSFLENRYALAINVLNIANNDTTENRRLWERYTMGGGFLDPEFEAYTGTSKQGEQKNYYISWKLDRSLGACKYYLYLSVKKDEAAKVEGDFIAVVRSLK